jgi:hypothetical protein
MRTSFTATIARNETWEGDAVTEPYECAWAGEAIIFVRALDAAGTAGTAKVQVSPDGIHWCDEGTWLTLPSRPGGMSFARITHFGGYLRLAAELPDGSMCKVIVALVLKA